MAVFATGKKAKQPVESSVNNEEAVQLEIGADHLVRLEEEDKAPEATLNVEWNESDEALGKTDEGLLEHSMTSSLLNHDDLELFQSVIERIESRGMKSVLCIISCV